MPGTPLSKLIAPAGEVAPNNDEEDEDMRPLMEADKNRPVQDD